MAFWPVGRWDTEGERRGMAGQARSFLRALEMKRVVAANGCGLPAGPGMPPLGMCGGEWGEGGARVENQGGKGAGLESLRGKNGAHSLKKIPSESLKIKYPKNGTKTNATAWPTKKAKYGTKDQNRKSFGRKIFRNDDVAQWSRGGGGDGGWGSVEGAPAVVGAEGAVDDAERGGRVEAGAAPFATLR